VTITVNGPNGVTINFPDGTSPDIINQVMTQAVTGKAPDTSASPVGVAEDMAKGFGSGVVKGGVGLASLPGTVEGLGRSAINWGAKKLGAQDNVVAPDAALPGYQSIKGAVERNVTGPLYDPKTRLGKVAGTVGEFAPGMLFPGGGAAGMASQMTNRAVRNVLAPGVASETAGQLTEGTAAEPYARVAGALLGPVAMTPFRQTSPTLGNSVNTLRQEGVTSLTAGEVTGRKPIRWAESAFNDAAFSGQRGARLNTEAAEQFTAAAARRAGIQSNRLTPEVMDPAFDRIGQVFDNVTVNNAMPVTAVLPQEAQRIAALYERTVPNALQSGVVRGIADDLAALQPGTTIPGTVYQGWRSELDAAARAAGNPRVTRAIYDMRNALDDAFENALTGAERQAFRQARREYRNILVLEQAVASAGEQAAAGLVTPRALAQATKTLHGKRNYVRGDGDFADLARAGAEVMSPLPQSGTAPRLVATELGKVVAGGAIGGATYGPEGAAAGGAAPLIAQALMGRAMLSRPGQAYLRNQMAAGPAIGFGANRGLVVAPSVAPEFGDKRQR
jgi:hypothetical protein